MPAAAAMKPFVQLLSSNQSPAPSNDRSAAVVEVSSTHCAYSTAPHLDVAARDTARARAKRPTPHFPATFSNIIVFSAMLSSNHCAIYQIAFRKSSAFQPHFALRTQAAERPKVSTGEIRSPYRGDASPQQGRSPTPAGKDANPSREGRQSQQGRTSVNQPAADWPCAP